MNEKRTNKLLFMSLFLLTIILIGVSYAFFVAINENIDSGSSTIIQMGTMKIAYSDTQQITANNIIPGWSGSKTIVVSNTGDVTVVYDLLWLSVINEFINDELVVSASCSSNVSGKTCHGTESLPVSEPGANMPIVTENQLVAGEVQTYVVTLAFLDTGSTQNYNRKKSFEGTFTVLEHDRYSSSLKRYLVDAILDSDGGREAISNKGTPDFSLSATTDEGLYAALDQDGTTYYFRGNTPDNIMEIDGERWRIVRINGDGSVRLIKTDAPSMASTGSRYTRKYAGDYCDDVSSIDSISKMIGCVKYGPNNTYPSASVLSIVNQYIDYYNVYSKIGKYMVISKYCNDYSFGELDSETNKYYFGSYYRNVINKNPSLTCTAPSGYTNGGTDNIESYVGLLTADEAYMAGGVWHQQNYAYYLADIGSYESYTMTPSLWNNMGEFAVTKLYSYIGIDHHGNTYGYSIAINPVINLSEKVEVIGFGTENNPYKIVDINVNTDDTLLTNKILNNEGGVTAITEKGVPDFTSIATTDEGMFVANDIGGTKSYYYRGNVLDNYVELDNFLWRIVRINGDGTIRLALNSLAQDPYNRDYSKAYNSSDVCATVDSITTSNGCLNISDGISTEKLGYNIAVTTWYKQSIASANNYIVNESFCNDYSNSYPTLFSNQVYYSGFKRLSVDHAPSLLCQAYSGYNNGSASTLNLNVGLITSDEMALAGAVYDVANNSFYLAKSSSYYTMSGHKFFNSTSYATRFTIDKGMTGGTVKEYKNGYVPVINLNSNVTATGSGTENDPYIITGLKE